MINLVYKNTTNFTNHELEDSAHIVGVFAKRGYYISLRDAWEAWSDFSDDMCAGWISLPDNDDVIFNQLFNQFEPRAD